MQSNEWDVLLISTSRNEMEVAFTRITIDQAAIAADEWIQGESSDAFPMILQSDTVLTLKVCDMGELCLVSEDENFNYLG